VPRAQGVETWSDPSKVALVSALTLPFSLGWVGRSMAIVADPSLTTYADVGHVAALMPFLWAQVVAHALLVAVALGLRQRGATQVPWLLHTEVQLWCGCLSYSVYNVGALTSPLGVVVVVLPVIGYLIFPARVMHFGMVTLGIGTALGIVLPLLHVVPYAPFLAQAPFGEGAVDPRWALTFGLPAFLGGVFGVSVHARLVQQLRERQAILERLGTTDALTGLANRNAFFERLDEEVARAQRHALPLTLLMVDADHFKSINDEAGHQEGDRVLRELGTRILGALRTGDVAARYGGEELAILLPHTSEADGEVVAGRVLAVARTIEVARRSSKASLTVSIGLARLREAETGDSLVSRADGALYQSKRGGRDRATTAE
jgi:diguanylate cyclase (GGDEF)-like protein